MLVLSVPGGTAGSRADLICTNTTPVSAQIAEAPSAAGALKSQIGWQPAEGGSNVLTLVAAGHAAGLYLISYAFIVRFVGSGTITGVASYSAPTLGAVSNNVIVGSLTITALGPRLTPTVAIQSSGINAITLAFGIAGPGGSPVVDLYASAILVGV